jgi:NDP-sugar pyrophosphorylase family protein
MPSLALLAGGLATRLRPVTEKVPKAMLEIAGKPFIEHQCRLMRRQGISQVVLCAGHLAGQIQDFLGDGSRFGLKVDYSLDGEKLLGTGGALKKALPLLSDPFWVLYGDSYLELDLIPALASWQASGLPGMMTVYHNQGLYDASNVLFGQGRILKYKKEKDLAMRHIDYGLGLLTKACFDGFDQEAFDLASVYGRLVDQGLLHGYEVDQRFFEIGSPEGMADTERHLLEAQHG